MAKQDLWELSKYDIIDNYSDIITTSDNEKGMIVIEDAPVEISIHKMSDLILVFNNFDETSVIIERIHRHEHSVFEWYYLNIRMWLKHKLQGEDGRKGMSTSLTFNKEYTDLAEYKKWWVDWLDELKKY